MSAFGRYRVDGLVWGSVYGLGAGNQTVFARRAYLVVAYANDYAGYIPPVGQANRGGYGEWPFMTRKLIPEAATMMTDAVIAMLHEMWAPAGAPA